MRPAAPSTRLALVTMTDAPSVTYATVVGVTSGVVTVAAVDAVSGIAEVGADEITGASVVVADASSSSSSSPPHAPSRRIPAATAASESIGARRCRRDVGNEEVASGPHARVTHATLVQVVPQVQDNVIFLRRRRSAVH